MTASVAEAYMLILRPVPILGEAWAIPFNGQIYVDDWKWELTRPSGQRAAGTGTTPSEGERGPQDRTGDPAEPARPALPRAEPPPPFDGDALIDAVRRMQINSQYTQVQRDTRVRRLIERAADEHARAQQQTTRRQESATAANGHAEGASSENKLTFTFSKNTDLATSQMLYSLANNDLIPSIILTLFHRSSTSPVTLVITMINCRLTDCTISCDGDETMSDIVEQWTAEYEHISYVYQNRPPAGIPISPFVAATQGRVKTFVMAPRGGSSPSPI
jgi:type VI protein secretion system component Hcp